MKVVIGFPTMASIIEFEPFLGNNIEVYREAFDNWYYEEVPSIYMGGTICKQRSDLNYTTLDVNVIIDWIKEVAPESNPVVLVEMMEPDDVDPALPGMYF
ncbi:MAG: hypothetical protein IKD76_00305 [Clostridia bacterium]|nr:hypothetical protein [Clostridia bacterium]